MRSTQHSQFVANQDVRAIFLRVLLAVVALAAVGPRLTSAQDFGPLPTGSVEVSGSYSVSISNPFWSFNNFAREWQDHCTYIGYHSMQDQGTGSYGFQSIQSDGEVTGLSFRDSSERGTIPSGEDVPTDNRWYFGGGGTNRCSAAAVQAAQLAESRAAQPTRYFFRATDGAPEADFEFAVSGPLLLDINFTDRSSDPNNQPLTYQWNFGDGSTSTESSPTHTFAQPGSYEVTLTVTDPGGLDHSREYRVNPGQALKVAINVTQETLHKGTQIPAQLTLSNVSETTLTGVEVSSLWTDSDRLMIVDGPAPAIPSTLSPGQQVTVDYTLETLEAGRLAVLGIGRAVLDQFELEAFGERFLTVIPNLEVSLSTDVTEETAIGDSFTVTATLTNADEDSISDISTGVLELIPSTLSSAVSGPTAAGGGNPQVSPITLAPGETTTITWVRLAEAAGLATISARVTGRNPGDNTLFSVDASTQAGIDLPDVSVLATSSFSKSGDVILGRYEIILTNDGGPAENVTLRSEFRLSERLNDTRVGQDRTGFPRQLHVTGISDPACSAVPSGFVGGGFSCNLSLPGNDDPQGNNVKFIEIEARVVNAADLPSLTFKAIVPGDVDPTDNENTASTKPTLDNGSLAQTRQAMAALDAYFDYETDLLGVACNDYRRDIYSRFEQIRLDNPEVFANLSYGPITSGDYTTEVGSRAGHVGLVVYRRDTDYRETGIVIHGTPSVSPLGAFADSFDTQVGQFPMGDQPLTTRLRGTSVHGYYYRTPAVQFPGLARPENDGCGFEGKYVDNANEFSRRTSCVPPAGAGNPEPDINIFTCPFEPNAAVITTESPVDIRATNSAGQLIETQDGVLVNQELSDGIHSIAIPHSDGTFGWTLVLPADDYEVELMGTGNGPYRLTMSRFDSAGESVDTIVEGTAVPGVVESFSFSDTILRDSFESVD